ncbi:MAG: DUF1565 domain-containing protein, partial [Verrucomicrobia bacterium]|nr:DUF1565 domain-containing protein [Verrucomicrobiota bacterium]
YRLQSDAPDVFFVSPTGDDTAKGASLKQPWRTLAHAARAARPGHTIYVTAGEYRETLSPAQSGTLEKPIRFLRYGRDRVVLDGAKRLPVGVDLSDRSHVTVKGFVVRDFSRHGILAQRGENVRIEQVIVTGSQSDGVVASAVAGLTFTHNLVRNCGGAGLRLDGTRGATVTGNLFEPGAGPRIACDAASLVDLWSDANAFPSATEAQLTTAADPLTPALSPAAGERERPKSPESRAVAQPASPAVGARSRIAFEAANVPPLPRSGGEGRGEGAGGTAFALIKKPQAPLFIATGRSYDSLAAWQKATALDPTSIAAPAGYRDADAKRCDFALRSDSPLIGRGP